MDGASDAERSSARWRRSKPEPSSGFAQDRSLHRGIGVAIFLAEEEFVHPPQLFVVGQGPLKRPMAE